MVFMLHNKNTTKELPPHLAQYKNHIIDYRITGVKETSPKNQLRLQYQWETLGNIEYRVNTPIGKLWVDHIDHNYLYDAKLVLEYHRSPFSLAKNDASPFVKSRVRMGIIRELNRYKYALELLNKKELFLVCNEIRVKPYFEELFALVGLPAKFILQVPQLENYKVIVSNAKYKDDKNRRFIKTIGCQWIET